MSKITYDNKSYINLNSGVPNVNKVTDADMNEIKSVVNDNYDEEKNDIASFFYENGDEIEFGGTTSNEVLIMPGYITSSSTTLFVTLNTPKRLDNITSVAIDSLEVEGRSQYGYLNNQSGYNEYVNEADYTISANVVAPNTITIKIVKSSAWTYGSNNTTITNNTLVTIDGYVKLTLS